MTVQDIVAGACVILLIIFVLDDSSVPRYTYSFLGYTHLKMMLLLYLPVAYGRGKGAVASKPEVDLLFGRSAFLR